MAEYAISTNLISWVPAKKKLFGWPQDGPEAEVVDAMAPGDYLIPKFSQTPDYRRSGGYQTEYVRGICAALDLDYEDELRDYKARVAGGQGAVPFVWRVVEPLPPSDRFPSPVPWNLVRIYQGTLGWPISTGEFLRLRMIPIEIARQFKATAAQGRHIQRLEDGTAEKLIEMGSRARGEKELRRLLLVRASDPDEALRLLTRAGIDSIPGDYLFLAQSTWIPGFFQVKAAREVYLAQEGPAVTLSPSELLDLVERATQRASARDHFKPGNLSRAARQLWEFTESNQAVEEIEEFGSFYDRFVNLPSKVSQALEIANRRESQARFTQTFVPDEDDSPEHELEGEDSEQLEEESLRGLTVAAVRSHLDGIQLPSRVLAEAVTAIRAGKHLLLSGPPGTGKSTVATALCRSVVEEEFQIATATADWTTFDTIGGYVPQKEGQLEFEPGIVLRCLERGRWLIIDELNRADIDKAFGPLFTLLSSAGEDGGGGDVTLPFRRAEKSVRIVWANRRDHASSPYALTPTWRLIGTLNVRDKATLFQLSFAFLRRFAVIEVPLPPEEDYRDLFEGWLEEVEAGSRSELVEAGMKVAFGRRPLGPAILKDIAAFVRIGMTPTETASGTSPYEEPVEAFLTAVRLFAVPQYEGALNEETKALLASLEEVWSSPPGAAWNALNRALVDVALT